MDTKDEHRKERFYSRMTKEQQFLLIICFCILVLWMITLFSILALERKNTERYRIENHDRLQVNLQMFEQIIEDTDSFCKNMSTSVGVLPSLEQYTAEEMLASQNESGFHVYENAPLFRLDSDPRKLFNRLLGIVMANRNYSELVFYLPRADVFVVLAENGRYAASCHGMEELRLLIDLQGDFTAYSDGELIAAHPTQYAASPLYVVRRISDSFLLCGIAAESFQNSLMLDNSGRSYKLVQMICRLPDGQMLARTAAELPLDEQQLCGNAEIEDIRPYTLMRFTMEAPACTLIAVLEKTGITSVFSAAWFRLLLVLNSLWVGALAVTYGYSIIRVFKPLRRIREEVAVQGDDSAKRHVDDLEQIANTIHNYHQQLSSSRKTIDEQIHHLRGACLKQLAMNQYPSLSQEQMDELGIPALLDRYVLVTLYPDDGRWGHEDCSEQEYRYYRHVILVAVRDTLNPQMGSLETQYLMLQSCMLMVIRIPGDEEEAFVRQRLESWVSLISAQLSVRLHYGISKARSGMDSVSRAYHEAVLHAALIEEKETGRSEVISLNALLKENNMADLIYMERYGDAFACFQEMVNTLLRQKGRHLRTQQLTSLLQMTLTMVTETNGSNANLIDQEGIDAQQLLSPDEEEKVLERWKSVFTLLEKDKNEQIHSQYSNQFAAVYQYMNAHFRDPGLSLSMMADHFGMSVSTLSREFQKNLGQGFLESLHHMRIEAARYEIEHTNVSLSDIAIAVGYTNALTMTRAFKKYLNCTPSVFRKKGTTT